MRRVAPGAPSNDVLLEVAYRSFYTTSISSPFESRQGSRAGAEAIDLDAKILQHGEQQVAGLHAVSLLARQDAVLAQLASRR